MENAKYVGAMIDAIEAAGIPYMLVGSLSSNVFGVARSTKDADLVVELGSRKVAEICSHLGSEFRLDRAARHERPPRRNPQKHPANLARPSSR